MLVEPMDVTTKPQMRKDVTVLLQKVLPFDLSRQVYGRFPFRYRVVHLCLFRIATDLVIPFEGQYAINHKQQMRTGGIKSTR